ncbi:HAD-like domain-containing protein [Chaetomium fimeti]|uniref:HAD-like domain-containing protein n=1 Tax=Chaetomium fimeti TaxID=1854472 RepID=A0AAE0LUZ3_9PEZI|nr:HAD-like domain-containing protein [Chaetomium fimeti]
MASVAVPISRTPLRGLAASLPARFGTGLSPCMTNGLRFSSTFVAGARRARPTAELGRRRRETAWTRGFKHDVKVGGSGRKPPSFAFAFDIDGVLLHVAKPIPGATRVLKFLNDYNIPFILLTNGGGKHETERVKDLEARLGVQLSTDNFVQSHTPFQELLEGPNSLRDKTVLVTGSDYEKCRSIFKEYGFKNVITPADIYAADPTIFPFQPAASFTTPSQPLPKPLYSHPGPPNPTHLPSHLQIHAIFVLNDPRDWALDIQIITDLLLSHAGYLGTYSPLNNTPHLPDRGWQRDGQPALYFSNADLLWSAGYHLPRLGQGAFQAAVAGLWKRVTGGEGLKRGCIGKPYRETYRFAERVLAGHRREVVRAMGGAAGVSGGGESGGGDSGDSGVGALERVYMVGDNPESDIAGANGYVSEEGTEWVSVLVKTGVWSEERGGKLEGVFKPKEVVGDVMGAVKWALKREGWDQEGKGKELD